ncbi:protein of unknown function [Shewanella benthica]|uniref:Uncharacterized protein n=1 Tax=Shewanella benthica TaxID=43661 RepID=A0A330M8Y6_9GAMM|nr:protein of unknown function [Shewanella benthica]
MLLRNDINCKVSDNWSLDQGSVLTKTKYASYYGLKHNEPSLSYLLNKEYD